MKISAVILNGGKSSRSGVGNKAFLKLGSKTFLEVIYKELSSIFEDIVVISKDNTVISKLIPGVKVYPDVIKSIGPLAGIYSGLIKSENSKLFVCACDMPFIEKSFICRLIMECEGSDITCFKIGDSIEPLCAIYDKNCITIIEEILQSSVKPSVMSLISMANTKFIDLELTDKSNRPNSFLNINTPEDYEKVLKLINI